MRTRQFKLILPVCLFVTIALLCISSCHQSSQTSRSYKSPSPIITMMDIPAGSFKRTDGLIQNLSAFKISTCEITKKQWDEVREWAITNGYEISQGSGQDNIPVGNVTWFDSIKWCNAYSEKNHLTPCYYLDPQHTTIYRSGSINISPECVNWRADGLKLPTEAQWEYACRAGTQTLFYWGDRYEDLSDYAWVVNYYSEKQATQPVGRKKPNAFGLYDMSGNVMEWCWDWYKNYQKDDPNLNPAGAAGGRYRILRGGSVALDSDISSARRVFTDPSYTLYETGFRVILQPGVTPEFATSAFTGCSQRKKLDSPSQENPKVQAAKKLFSLINLDSPGLSAVKAEFVSNNFENALDLYRDFFIKKVRSQGRPIDFERVGWAKMHELDELMTMNPPFKYFGPDAEFNQDISDMDSLYDKWQQTKERRYLDKLLYILNDFAINGKNQYDSLTPDQLHQKASPLKKASFVGWASWGWNNGFVTTVRSQHLMVIICNVAASVESGQNDVINSQYLANILVSITTDHLNCTIRDPRLIVPNQVLFCSRYLRVLSVYLPEFCDSPFWADLGTSLFRDKGVANSILPDGGFLEQSFNYNSWTIHMAAKTEKLFSPSTSSGSQKAADRLTLAGRLLTCLQFPTGGYPKTGTNSNPPPPAIWKEPALQQVMQNNAIKTEKVVQELLKDQLIEQIDLKLWADNNAPSPSFNSIAFPYSGYYVQRTGWQNQDLYLWLMGARHATGHASRNINTISIEAYGRQLLTDSGPPPYGVKELPAEYMHDFEKIEDYFQGARSHNTIIVDGYDQRRLFLGESSIREPYSDPIAARWLAGDNFDFAESFYTDAYGNKETKINVDHSRQSLLFKNAQLWIIRDILYSKEKHAYSQYWNFPPPHSAESEGKAFESPGFLPGQIQFNSRDKIIKTIDPNGPNICLYQFTDKALDYKMYYGQRKPVYKGWYSPATAGACQLLKSAEIEVNWNGRGDEQIVTLVVPTKDMQSKLKSIKETNNPSAQNKTSIEFISDNGIKVIYEASIEISDLQTESVLAKAKVLVLQEDPSGVKKGICLNCEKFAVNNNEIKLASADFEFTIKKDDVKVAPLIIPTTFKWIQTSGGLMPSYN